MPIPPSGVIVDEFDEMIADQRPADALIKPVDSSGTDNGPEGATPLSRADPVLTDPIHDTTIGDPVLADDGFGDDLLGDQNWQTAVLDDAANPVAEQGIAIGEPIDVAFPDATETTGTTDTDAFDTFAPATDVEYDTVDAIDFSAPAADGLSGAPFDAIEPPATFDAVDPSDT